MLSVPVFWRMNKEKYRMIGKKCLDCGLIIFPNRKNCPTCDSQKLEEFGLSGKGKIYSDTIIRVAPDGFEAPYITALIKLEEGPMIVGEVTGLDPEDLDPSQGLIDKEVSTTFRKIMLNENGLRVYGLKFLLE